MGINGLLPLLKSIHKPCSLKKFDGKTLGVDAYGWLHRGTVACAMELALGKPTRKFVDFAMHRVRMLQHYGVTPYLIFDGDYLPSKAATEADRLKRREDSRKAGLSLLNAGKAPQAYQEFQKAVDVTPEMARQLIDELKKVGVKYVVAPYEADAQMVYLERKGIIHGIISEDSDLLVFGAKCLLTKLDQYGNCIEINKADFCAVREISLTGWSDAEFRMMAILSGCDYLAGINKMGLKTAYRMVRKYKTVEKIIRMLQFDGKFSVPKSYLEDYQRAELTFLHQRVFCPRQRRLVFHTEPQQTIDDAILPFLGHDVDPEIAQRVACGDLNPNTKLPIISRQDGILALDSPFSARQKLQRPASFADTPNKDKKIETFFRAKRVPLAELDVNCFTPSPTQQDALRRNSGPWTASPAPRPYLNRAATEPQSQSSTPPVRQVARPLGQTVRADVNSTPRPVKRARLCADADVEASAEARTELRSRFFGGSASSPSLTRSTKARKSKKSDITIFSDDSIEDVMLSIPDNGSMSQETSQAKDTAAEASVDGVGRDSQDVTNSSEPTSQVSLPSLADSFTSMSSSVELEQPLTPTEPLCSPASLHGLSERFSANPSKTPRPIIVNRNLPTPVSTGPRPSRIPLAVKSNLPTPQSGLTPLQRLGFRATYKPKGIESPPITPTNNQPKYYNSQRRRSLLSKDAIPFPEVLEQKVVQTDRLATTCDMNPAFVPLPEVDEEETIALNSGATNENVSACMLSGKGSEDFIIHDSEEDEPLSPAAGEGQPKLDLGRFIYAG